MTSWIVKVKGARGLEPVILGNIEAAPGESRAQIKVKAVALVRKHFDLDVAKIIGIARGRVTVDVQGEWIDFDTMD